MDAFSEIARDVRARFHQDPGLAFRVGFGDGGGTALVEQVLEHVHMVIPEPNIEMMVHGPGKDDREGDPATRLARALAAGHVDAVVRGTLPSSGFLKALALTFGVTAFHRFALLTTPTGKDFFLAPVGIDEGFTTGQKGGLVDACMQFLPRLGIEPGVFLLSAGRLGDVGRHEHVTRSMNETIALVDTLRARHPGKTIVHGEILIENAFAAGCNVIIAPDGVSGNLIYRTLVHLGSGTSRGAFYMDDAFPGPVMDTSRAGTVEEHAGAVVLAAGAWLAMQDLQES